MASVEEDVLEGKLFATFGKYDEFSSLQAAFLAADFAAEPTDNEDTQEGELFRKLLLILGEYQEQSYLLDPFLEQLVVPVVECFKNHTKVAISTTGPLPVRRIQRLSLLLYQYIMCRGYKTIVRFFPHEIADMSIALDYMMLPHGPIRKFPSRWSLPYIVLLWLSLICMIPFDLDRLDELDQIGRTADSVESLAKEQLGSAGLEREGAAIVLSRFYMRKDTRIRFHKFLDWSLDTLQGSPDLFVSMGLLQVLCEILKSSPIEELEVKIPQFFALGSAIGQCSSLENNTVMRKMKLKFMSRLALRLLPAKSRVARKGLVMTGATFSGGFESSREQEEVEVPEEVETMLEELFKGLQDRDTIVRWSAAKGVARVAERLPVDFSDQVLDTITGLFAIHSLAAASLYDLPAIAERTWHGACLGSAEMARRGLVPDEKLPDLIEWLSKALYFDIRKGAHSIGSNVRDASAYALWSLARAQDASSLAPHATNLARRLATVSLYDREIHIRRAASAAFQEHVGRMSLFPHGIDVLRKTDFYAVSVRRNSFLVAAPQVAEHPEYRSFLINHILTITLRHWEVSMRVLGAQSLRVICQIDLEVLGLECARKAAELFQSVDVIDIHGGLLALTEISIAFGSSAGVAANGHRHKIFEMLLMVPQDILTAPRNELIITAACELIASSISAADVQLGQKSVVPQWRSIVDVGLRHRSSAVQEGATHAMAAVSKLVDCSSIVERLIREFRSGAPPMQQSLGLFLGALDYDAYSHNLLDAVQCLLESVDPSLPTRMANVEARRNCYVAMPQILRTTLPRLSEHLSPTLVSELFGALLNGLQDYTLDQRGDVGSWVRMACIKGLGSFAEMLFSQASGIPDFSNCLPAVKYHAAISGILRQGVERLDVVRQVAGESISRLLALPLPNVPDSNLWQIDGEPLMNKLFLSDVEADGWKDGAWFFPRAVQLLEIQKYRPNVLAGLIVSIGTKTDSTRGPVSSSVITYAKSLPVYLPALSDYDLVSFVGDIIRHVKSNLKSNAVVIPVLQTFNILIVGDALDRLSEESSGIDSLQDLILIATRNVARLKSVERILESMKLVVNLLPFPRLSQTCVPQLVHFLGHAIPKVRSDAAEYLYLVIQGKDLEWETDEAEEILLETEWSSIDVAAATRAADSIGKIFSGGVE